jgi:hypothetical protein
MPVAVAKPKRRVAVVDDTPDNMAHKSDVVRLAGYDPVPLRGQYQSVQDLLAEVGRVKVTGLLCDHKLSEGNYAGFQGVEAVAALYGSKTPAILVTDYMDGDLRVSIRKYRKKVPVLIKGSDLRPRALIDGIEAWEKEVMRNEIPVERRARRAFVRIDGVKDGPNGRIVTVFVPRWREHEAVTLPQDVFPQGLHADLKKGALLIASVNTEAPRIEDLFFEDFEVVPPEDLSDEAP